MIRIKISSDFSEIPGGRLKREGKHSGEEFRDELLLPKYREAEKNDTELEVDFDDCYGIGTSFLEEAFGGMVRVHHIHGMLQRLKMISNEDETIPGNISKYIKEAEGMDKK